LAAGNELTAGSGAVDFPYQSMTTIFIGHSSKDKAWAEEVREALRDGGYQSLFLDFHPDDGIHVGAKWEAARAEQRRRALKFLMRFSRQLVTLIACHLRWARREKETPVFERRACDSSRLI